MAELDPNRQIPSPEETTPPVKKKKDKKTVFFITAIIIALILFAAAVMDPLITVAKSILSLLSPLIIGCIIAYLCDPILELFEYRVFRRMKKGGLRRGLSLFCTVIVAFGIVGVIFAMMIPQLVLSIKELFANYETYINSFLRWFQDILNKVTANLPIEIIDISDIEKFTAFLSQIFGNAENSFSDILDDLQKFMSDGNVLEKTWALLLQLFNTFKNLFIGIFIAFYLLASKEKRIAQIRKFRKAMFSKKADDRIEEIVTLADKTFGGFIFGKILDSLVIGILTFVMLTIFDVSPYNLLIATFIGITNVIPVFGPFIGAIPSFFIVLISNPEKAFLFLVLILIIQQLDGNIIGPKILGDNTGVSSLCVIIAIAICSTLWGVMGMIIGVPIFAVVIELIKRMLEKRLIAKGEPTDTLEYYSDDAVGNAEMDVYYEHSSLRYRYEHSSLKPRMDRIKQKLFSHMGKQPDSHIPDESPSLDDTADSAKDSEHTDS